MGNLAVQNLLKKYNRAVPRYTSYPTTPHFLSHADQRTYRNILRAIPEDKSISLYIHIPFCRHLCLYCGCHTKIVDHQAPIKDYLELVRGEIILATEAIGRKQKVSHIHFGGGTPNFSPADDLRGILSVISDGFSLSDGTVVAMEMDPRLLTHDNVKEFMDIGVNRVSLGVQDFHPDVQKAVNRIQSYEHISNCVEWFRSAGMGSINFDMMYGLPLQTVEKIHDNIAKLKILQPDRVALFAYAHVPWFKEHQKKLESHGLPDVLERFEMSEAARRDLISAGYDPIGIDHFSLSEDTLAQALKQKRLHRNFQGYTTDNEEILIGFGQTSISDYHSAYFQNTDRNRDYRDKIVNGEFPIVKSCILVSEDIYRRSVIENIMCYGEVDLMALDDAHEWADIVWHSAHPHLAELMGDGLVTLGDMDLEVTPAGRPFTRLIASAFDAYLFHDGRNSEVPRHARTI